MTPYDVAIIGGGPAGLSAALILGRCRRRVILFDSDTPRNAAARHMHGFLGRDATPPRQLREDGRRELARYGVEIADEAVEHAEELAPHNGAERVMFLVRTSTGRIARSRKLLLATGIRDLLPPIPGLAECYGQTVHHCPYCDGWEHRDQHLAALGETAAKAAGLALLLRIWSSHVTALTNGEKLQESDQSRLARHGIAWREERISSLDHEDKELRRVVFSSGEDLAVDACFFNAGQRQQSDLVTKLGCGTDEESHVPTSNRQQTDRRGLFLAGDADGDVQFVIVAAAEGATAGIAINRELQGEDFQ